MSDELKRYAMSGKWKDKSGAMSNNQLVVWCQEEAWSFELGTRAAVMSGCSKKISPAF
jgi:hypothetical protein